MTQKNEEKLGKKLNECERFENARESSSRISLIVSPLLSLKLMEVALKRGRSSLSRYEEKLKI